MKYNKWNKDLQDATKAIESIKDTVLPRLISGKLHSIENADNKILLMMDQVSGIDLIRQNSAGLQGVASRVQFGHSFNTFTIRSKRKSGAKTELEKRLQQIKEGYFYPAFTLQAYFDNRKDLNLLSIAIIRTEDLYLFIKKGNKVYTRESDNVFKYCKWSDLKKSGCAIRTLFF